MHPPIYITYLNGLDVAELKLSDDEILAAIESSLAAQGRGHTVIEPRMHLIPDATVMAISTCCAGRSARRSSSQA